MPDPNPYDSTVSDITSGAAAIGARASVSSVADRNPDAEAQVQRQAAQLGVPYESARNNPAILTQRSAAQAVDYDNLARAAPVTTRYLSNPANAAVSHDDVGVLGGIENWIADKGTYLGRNLGSAFHSVVGIGAQALNDVYSTFATNAETAGRSGIPTSISTSPAAFLGLSAYNAMSPQGQSQRARIANNPVQQFAVGQQQTANRISQDADQAEGTSGLAYATLDPSKSAFLHPTKIAGDIARGLPTLAALVATTYLTKGEGAGALGAYMGVSQQLDTLTNLGDGEIRKSPAYRSLVNAGVSPSDAANYVRSKTAGDEGLTSGAINTLLAGLAGPLASKTGGSLWKGLGLDSMTWGAMGGASQFGSNAVEKADVNPDKNPFEGVGEAFLSNATAGPIFGPLTDATGRTGAVQ